MFVYLVILFVFLKFLCFLVIVFLCFLRVPPDAIALATVQTHSPKRHTNSIQPETTPVLSTLLDLLDILDLFTGACLGYGVLYTTKKSSIIFLHTNKPSPIPSPSFLVVKNGENILS